MTKNEIVLQKKEKKERKKKIKEKKVLMFTVECT